jgi:hypothetical protein
MTPQAPQLFGSSLVFPQVPASPLLLLAVVALLLAVAPVAPPAARAPPVRPGM